MTVFGALDSREPLGPTGKAASSGYTGLVRSLVLALALAVSPLDAVVCEVACVFDDVAHDHGALEASACHGAADALAVSAADDDHDCPHPEGAPAVLTSAKPGLFGLPAADLSAAVVFSSTPTITRSVAASVAWSPPHSPHPALPLRI
jgi:hypothetical protein